MGQYYPAESPVHSMDPRAKIAIAVIFMIVLFLGNNFYAFIVMGAFAFLAAAMSKVPARLLLRGLRPYRVHMAFTLILHLFLTPGPSCTDWTSDRDLVWAGAGLFIGVRLVI
jgi:energy-coupling factor transport system permease protein